MTDISKGYFDWLCEVIDYGGKTKFYKRTLKLLHHIDFSYTIPKDANRFEDGIDLRYRYGYEHHIDYPEIADILDSKPCSVLEMMVALAVRCEEHIMYDAEKGDRQSKWFWKMFDNLGLKEMTNSNFDEDYILDSVERFLRRDYDADGTGGLFTTSDPTKDMRTEEIWYQLMWYLNDRRK
jgi:hypothetical protein